MMSLLADLDAFFTEHQRCGDLDAGVDGPRRLDRVRLRGEDGARTQEALLALCDDRTGGGRS
jgi:hypothetical protein